MTRETTPRDSPFSETNQLFSVPASAENWISTCHMHLWLSKLRPQYEFFAYWVKATANLCCHYELLAAWSSIKCGACWPSWARGLELDHPWGAFQSNLFYDSMNWAFKKMPTNNKSHLHAAIKWRKLSVLSFHSINLCLVQSKRIIKLIAASVHYTTQRCNLQLTFCWELTYWTVCFWYSFNFL